MRAGDVLFCSTVLPVAFIGCLLVAELGGAQEHAEDETRSEVRVLRRAVVLRDDGSVLEVRAGAADGSTSWHHRSPGLDLDGDRIDDVLFLNISPGDGYLGVHLLSLTKGLRRYFGTPSGIGVLVSEVAPDSPADHAGLEPGDVVTSFDGEPVSSAHQLTRLVRSSAQEEVEIVYWRDGAPHSPTAVLGSRKRRVVRLGRGGGIVSWSDEDGDRSHHIEVVIDDAVADLQRYFDGDEWKSRVDRFRTLDWRTIEDRMKEVEEQLHALERRLGAQETDTP